MQKRFIALFTSVLILSTMLASTNVGAVDILNSHNQDLVVKYSAAPFASAYLDDYSISFGARGNCRMVVTMDVNAVRTVDKLGCLMLIIEHKVDGTWYEYDTLYGIEEPGFYMYNTASYLGTYSFYGEPGVQYRATMIAYAQDSTGYDTGEDLTSHVVTCSE